MLFSEPAFLFIFLPIVLAVFALVKRTGNLEATVVFLAFASLAFYSVWNIAYLPLLLLSIAANYFFACELHRTRTSGAALRKAILTTGIAFNLGLLFFFKYRNFFIDTVCEIAGCQMRMTELLLPLGISFFTFQKIAFLVDRYKDDGTMAPLARYGLFVTFFPQLIAGPIVHHSQFMPQIGNLARKLPPDYIWCGITIFCIGLFKKVAMADQIGPVADTVFSTADMGQNITFLEAWIALLGFTFQIYFDFSAYSDMAVGLGLLFGIVLPLNFNSPYQAINIQDFWRRWHITLSRFLRDYVYIPLGGNRVSPVALVYVNIMLTMLIGGLWHGASWTFIVWGALHGAALCLHRFLRPLMQRISLVGAMMRNGLGMLLTFAFVTLSWVFFRAQTFGGALEILRSLVDTDDIALRPDFLHEWYMPAGIAMNPSIRWEETRLDFDQMERSLWLIPAMLLIALLGSNAWRLTGLSLSACEQAAAGNLVTFARAPLSGSIATAIYAGILFALSLLFIWNPVDFIYFEF